MFVSFRNDGDPDLPVPIHSDPGNEASKTLALTGGEGVVLIGPNMHLVILSREVRPAGIRQALDMIAERTAACVGGLGIPHPPVLMVPDVLSCEDCKRLITIFRTDGNVWREPGHLDDKNLPKHDYKMNIPEYGRKDRVDHWLMNAQTNAFIDDRLRRRLFPEIRKAFQYRVTRREGYRIASYEGERGGEPKGHRDNTTAQVAHRRFAVSINLNSEGFAGAGIRFLEYGDQHYKPATGEAVVFSSSLLHEVMHVESGHRHVLLGFLFGDT